MKNKLIYLGLSIVLILILIIVNICSDTKRQRIWQHEVSKKEIKTDNVEEFNTHLPIVTINTNGMKIPGEQKDGTYITTDFKIYDNDEKNNYLTDIPKIENLAQIHYRGRSSIKFDKKGYKIKFVDENAEEIDKEVMGMSEHSEWVLNGPFLDKTLIRNYLMYNLAGEIMEYSPNCRFCELFVDNEYKGIYLMMETVTRADKGRIDISKYKKDGVLTSYIVRLDTGSNNDIQNINNFGKYTKILGETLNVNIEYPNNNSLTPELIEKIQKDLSEFEKMLHSFDYKKYEEYIDVDSFVDYFLLNEFCKNYDAGFLSTYLYKDIRGKFKLCVWDFNNAFDNFQENTVKESEFLIIDNIWYQMLFKDEEFVEKVINRYYELRKTFFSEEYLNEKIDDTIKYLGDAKKRNFEIWGYTFSEKIFLLNQKERNIHSYEDAVTQLKTFIKERIKFLDKNIMNLKQYSHESVNKKYNH